MGSKCIVTAVTMASVSTPSLSNRTSYFLPGMIASLPLLNFLSFPLVCVLSCLLPAPAVSLVVFYTLPTILSVSSSSLFLCGRGLVMFFF